MVSDRVTFSSNHFKVEAGEHEKTNPGIYGKALAEWMAAQLRRRGVLVEEIVAEDFGRCVLVKRKPIMFWVGCASVDDNPTRWQMFIALERGLMARLRRIDGTTEHSMGKLVAAEERQERNDPNDPNVSNDPNDLLCRRPREFLVAALEVRDAAALELPDARADFLEQVLVVRHEQDGALELLQRDVQRVDRLEVQVVGGLVEDEDVRLLQHDPAEQQPRRLAARQRVGRLVAVLAAEQHLAEQTVNVLA